MHPELKNGKAQALNVCCHAVPHCPMLRAQLIRHVCQHVADSIDGAAGRCLLCLQPQSIFKASDQPLPAIKLLWQRPGLCRGHFQAVRMLQQVVAPAA